MRRHVLPIILVPVLAFGLVPPATATASSIDLTINRIGFFSRSTGMAVVSGTVTCDAQGGLGTADISATQKVGRYVIEDYVTTAVVCDGTVQPWQAAVLGNKVDKHGNGLYHGGPASVGIYVYADGDEARARQEVKLRATR